MRKLKFNKKGMKKLIVGLFVMIMMIIIISAFFGNSLIPGFRGFGDNARDIMAGKSPCECGWPTPEKYEQIEHEGEEYCVASNNPCGPNLDKDLFKTINYARVGDPVRICVYLPSDCEESKK